MRHLFEKSLRIDYPTFKAHHSNAWRVLPPIVFDGSASAGASVLKVNDKHTASMRDATDASTAAMKEGFRIAITGGAGFFQSIMHYQCAPTVNAYCLSITNTTPHIAKAEGVLPDVDQVTIAENHGFSLRKAFFGIGGAELNNRGGSGTVDEFMQTIECMVYGDMSRKKPVAFNNRDGFYDRIFDQLRLSEQYGYLPAGFVDRLIVGTKGRDLIAAIKHRLLSLSDEDYHKVTHYTPIYRGKNHGGVVTYEQDLRKVTSPWKKDGFGKAPVIALVTGRSVDDDSRKKSKRHQLTDDIDVKKIIGDIKRTAPNAVILFVNEASRLAMRIHREAREARLSTLGVSAVSHNQHLMMDTGATKQVDDSQLIDSFILEHADVIVPMDLSMRAQSLFWQALVYCVIREPVFAVKELILFGKNGIADYTMAMIQNMIKAGVISPDVLPTKDSKGCFYYATTEEQLGDNINQILSLQGKRAEVTPYPPSPMHKIQHVKIPPPDRMTELTPDSIRRIALLIQPPTNGNTMAKKIRDMRDRFAVRV